MTSGFVALATPGLLALGGVALGALLNGLFTHSARRAERAERRRRELLDLTAVFLRDVDALWRSSQRLSDAVLEIQATRGSGPLEVRQHWSNERLAAFEDRREPERDSELAIMTFQIVAPTIVETATALRDASRSYKVEESRKYEDRRAAASRKFLKSVQAVTK